MGACDGARGEYPRRALFHPLAAGHQVPSGNPQGSEGAPVQGRDPHDGRPAHCVRGERKRAVVGGPDQRLCMDDHAGVHRVFGGGVHRRLHEGIPPSEQRSQPAREICRSDAGGRDRHAPAGVGTGLFHTAGVPVLQDPEPGSRVLVHPVRHAGHGGDFQRGESDGRARRAGYRSDGRRRAGVLGVYLHHGACAVRAVPAT